PFFFRFRESNAQQHSERGPSPKTVVLHARPKRKREKKQNKTAPKDQKKPCLLFRGQIFPGRWFAHAAKSRNEKDAPREEPDQMSAEPQPKRHGFIIGRIPRAHSALEMLVNEVRPKKCFCLQAREYVPGCSHYKQDEGTGNEVQLPKAMPA